MERLNEIFVSTPSLRGKQEPGSDSRIRETDYPFDPGKTNGGTAGKAIRPLPTNNDPRSSDGEQNVQPYTPIEPGELIQETASRPGSKYAQDGYPGGRLARPRPYGQQQQSGNRSSYWEEHTPPSHMGSRPPYQREENTPFSQTRNRSSYHHEENTPHPQATYGNSQPRNNTIADKVAEYASRSQPHQDRPYIQPRPGNTYHPIHIADDYEPMLSADAVDEWEEDGMIYEDWEQNQNDQAEYQEKDIEIIRGETYFSTYPHAHPPRKIDSISAARNLRERQQPSYQKPGQNNGFVRPAPQRSTQPLDIQFVNSQVSEREITIRQTDPRLTRPTRTNRQERPEQAHKVSMPAPMPKTAKNACPRCKGAGFLRANVPYGDPHFGKPIACSCKETERKEKRRHQLREMSNIEAFRDQLFQTYNTSILGVKEAFQAARDFSRNPTGWLLLIGPNGCGKTHLAAAVANQSLDNGSVVLFEPVPDLLDHLRAAFAPTASEVYDQLFAKMREAEVLVLDDLGAQQSSPWANEKLFQLLNYRYNLEMPTVITANKKGILAIDERIRSRLGDAGLVRTINMDQARDYRPTNIKKH